MVTNQDEFYTNCVAAKLHSKKPCILASLYHVPVFLSGDTIVPLCMHVVAYMCTGVVTLLLVI